MGGEFFGSYYDVLRVGINSSADEIRHAYRRYDTPIGGRRSHRCSVFSDERKRMMYDAGLYDPNEEEDEGFCDFVQEMLLLMAQSRSENQNYSLEDLQGMLMEMTQEFELPQWPSFEGTSRRRLG